MREGAPNEIADQERMREREICAQSEKTNRDVCVKEEVKAT